MLKAELGSLFKFSRQNRLVSKHDFQSVFANPQKIAQSYLLLLYRSNQLPYARLGITISKHRIKKAVDRNLVRRIIRESFRFHQKTLKGLDLIVLIRSECTPLKHSLKSAQRKRLLREDIDKLWRHLTSYYKPA